MSKIFAATCDANGKVKVEGFEVDVAVVLSEGKAASSGVALFQDDKCFYIPSSATDVKATIDQLVLLIEKLATTLGNIATTYGSIAGAMTGPTTAPWPTLATDVTAMNTKVTELNQIKSDLNTLKGALK